MKFRRFASLFAFALLLVAGATAGEELTVNSILTAHRSGAPTDGIVAMIYDPSNTVTLTTDDLATLRNAGVAEAVIDATYTRVPRVNPASMPRQPDDLRLVDLALLIKSGISESTIAEQIRRSSLTYRPSVNDLLYLEANGAQQSTIAALMATGSGTSAVPELAAVAPVPGEMTFPGLVRKASMKRARPGHLELRGETLFWVDAVDTRKNFDFKVSGLERVWFTCQERTPTSFCYQINFQIVKGDRYQFQNVDRESGSNASVLAVMEALRTYFPRLAYGTSDNG